MDEVNCPHCGEPALVFYEAKLVYLPFWVSMGDDGETGATGSDEPDTDTGMLDGDQEIVDNVPNLIVCLYERGGCGAEWKDTIPLEEFSPEEANA